MVKVLRGIKSQKWPIADPFQNELSKLSPHSSNFMNFVTLLFQGGVYLVNFLNVYGPGLAILFVVFVEAAGVFWFYGVDNFSTDVESMIGHRPGLFWRICWAYISPVRNIYNLFKAERRRLTSRLNVFSFFPLRFRGLLCRYFYWWYLSFRCLAMRRCWAKNIRIPIGALCLAGSSRCHR